MPFKRRFKDKYAGSSPENASVVRTLFDLLFFVLSCPLFTRSKLTSRYHVLSLSSASSSSSFLFFFLIFFSFFSLLFLLLFFLLLYFLLILLHTPQAEAKVCSS